MEHNMLRLPLGVISKVDVGRLKRELLALDEFLRQAALKKSNDAASLPRTSKLLETLAADNKLDLLDEQQRQQLMDFMASLAERAPVLHFSFASDPPPTFLAGLVTWLRQDIHPLALITVGLQPSIAAGCVLRTTDSYFDFSLRSHFADKTKLLIELLGAKS